MRTSVDIASSQMHSRIVKAIDGYVSTSKNFQIVLNYIEFLSTNLSTVDFEHFDVLVEGRSIYLPSTQGVEI